MFRMQGGIKYAVTEFVGSTSTWWEKVTQKRQRDALGLFIDGMSCDPL